MVQKISYYKKKIKNTPFHMLVLRVIKKVLAKVRMYYIHRKFQISGDYKSDDYYFLRELSSSFKKEDVSNLFFKKITKNNFYELIINRKDKEFIIKNIKQRNDIIKKANDICNHIFDLLGSNRVNVRYNLNTNGVEKYNYSMKIKKSEIGEIKGKINKKISNIFSELDMKNYSYLFNRDYEPIDWHIDFKSGYRWDSTLSFKKKRYGKDLGADIKVPWELSRLYHFVTLGQAYLLTEDEKYTKEFIYQTIDWIENNPPQFGVNWVCTMDVAIRAANWVLGLSYFKESSLINEKFFFEFIKNLYIHGKHIIGNLEYGILTSNHYISDIVGLAYLGIIFKDFKGVRNWLDFSVNEFVGEIKKQVYPDGCDFEASTCYHRLVLELFLFSTLLVVINDEKFNGENYKEVTNKIFGKEYAGQLYKMFEAVLYLLKPNGKISQIGDNDNGRLHIFANREALDMRYLLTFGAIFFKENRFKLKEFGFSEEAFWAFGDKGYLVWEDLEGSTLSDIKSKAFSDAGWYIMRRNQDYMIVSCGPNGQNGNGGHAHNDKLSFELSINGKDIILDPGTYVYTPFPEWRNRFRSTSFHNTVVIDCQEQNRFNNHNLFFSEKDAKCKINLWKTNERYDFLDAEHYGYKRLENPVIHRRQFFFNKKESYWVIKDILMGTEWHTFDLYFHISNNVNYKVYEDSLVVTIIAKDNVKLRIIPLLRENLGLFFEDGWVSRGYGEKTKSTVLRYSKAVNLPAEFLFVITKKDVDYSLEEINGIIETITNEE